jgi:hypothetical protein
LNSASGRDRISGHGLVTLSVQTRNVGMQGLNVLSQLVAVDAVILAVVRFAAQFLMRAFQRGRHFEQATVFVFVESVHRFQCVARSWCQM